MLTFSGPGFSFFEFNTKLMTQVIIMYRAAHYKLTFN
jgi:hypothetical protein